MAYNDYTSRSDVAGGLPQPIIDKIFEGVVHESMVARAFTVIPMSSGTERMAVSDSLPLAFWQNPSEVGLAQVSDFGWANKTLTAETITVMVPIAKTVFEDSQFDVMTYLTKQLVQALAHKIDRSILFGGGETPASFPTSLWASIVANSATVTANSTSAAGGLAQDFNLAATKVVESGYNPTAIFGARTLANKIRSARATDGQRYMDLSTDNWEGLPIIMGMGNNDFFKSGSGQALAIVLDSTQYVLGVRRDIKVELIDQGVVNDPSGKVVWNTSQQDLVIVKASMRVGWQCAGAVNLSNQSSGTNEVQTLTQGSSADGVMTISFNGYTTSELAADATEAEVKAALEALASIGVGNVTVARGGSDGAYVYTVTFVNALGSKNLPQMTATIGTGTITPATTTAGAVGARVSAAGLIVA